MSEENISCDYPWVPSALCPSCQALCASVIANRQAQVAGLSSYVVNQLSSLKLHTLADQIAAITAAYNAANPPE